MKSLRLDEELAGRISTTAQRLRVSDSEVIRRALDEYCDPAPGESVAEALGDYIGAFEGSGELAARDVHRLFGEIVGEKWRRREAAPEPTELARVAESKAAYRERE